MNAKRVKLVSETSRAGRFHEKRQLFSTQSILKVVVDESPILPFGGHFSNSNSPSFAKDSKL